MNQEEKARVVESYIASSKFSLGKDRVLRRAGESDWASQVLYKLASREPALVLELCISIAKQDGSEETLERVANGPLVEVLKSADDALLAGIVRIASAAPALRELLSCVWEDNELAQSTWVVIRDNSAE
ncbi:MAG TPA: hypothetical protein VIU34_10285 [Steroidobacter sp.]